MFSGSRQTVIENADKWSWYPCDYDGMIRSLLCLGNETESSVSYIRYPDLVIPNEKRKSEMRNASLGHFGPTPIRAPDL